MGRLTKEHERALFVAEFLRRLREAAPRELVYMRVGNMFKDPDVIDLDEWQAARRKDSRGNHHGEWSGIVGRHGVRFTLESVRCGIQTRIVAEKGGAGL